MRFTLVKQIYVIEFKLLLMLDDWRMGAYWKGGPVFKQGAYLRGRLIKSFQYMNIQSSENIVDFGHPGK